MGFCIICLSRTQRIRDFDFTFLKKWKTLSSSSTTISLDIWYWIRPMTRWAWSPSSPTSTGNPTRPLKSVSRVREQVQRSNDNCFRKQTCHRTPSPRWLWIYQDWSNNYVRQSIHSVLHRHLLRMAGSIRYTWEDSRQDSASHLRSLTQTDSGSSQVPCQRVIQVLSVLLALQ